MITKPLTFSTCHCISLQDTQIQTQRQKRLQKTQIELQAHLHTSCMQMSSISCATRRGGEDVLLCNVQTHKRNTSKITKTQTQTQLQRTRVQLQDHLLPADVLELPLRLCQDISRLLQVVL